MSKVKTLPVRCRLIIELAGEAGRLGYNHIAFAKLGPDYEEAINLLTEQVVPALR